MARRDSILVSRTLYQVGVVTMVAAIVWVLVGIYFATGKEFKIDIDKSILEPINPVLDQEVIKAMASRTKIEIDLTIPPDSSAGGVR